MIIPRKKHKLPSLNTTSTADISFMLLIFFLVTSSMDADKGLPRQLPPPPDEEIVEEQTIKERNILEICIDGNDRLTCNGDSVSTAMLTERIMEFVANKTNDASLPEKSRREVNYFGTCYVSDRHVISIRTDRETTYDAYFRMQNAVMLGYARLRNQLAHKQFHRSYAECSQDEREAIGMVYPQRISEQMPTEDNAISSEKGGKSL